MAGPISPFHQTWHQNFRDVKNAAGVRCRFLFEENTKERIMRTYRPYEIGRALGVNSRRITSAVDRGLLPGDRGNGSGHHREFTRDAIMHFALMCRLVDLGLTPSRASVIAGKHHGAEGVLMVTASGTDVQSQDKIIDIPHNVLLVDLALLADEVDEKLRAVA